MLWAGDSSPLDELKSESAADEHELPGQRLSASSRKRIYAVLCLAASASGRRTPGRVRVLGAYRRRLGISATDADLAETMAGHMKSLRIGRRQPEQDAVMSALVELLTADGRAPTARERQLLERIGKRASWSPARIEALVRRRLEPEEDSGTGELPASDDPFGASLVQPSLPGASSGSAAGDDDPFGASLQAPALKTSAPGDDPFASLDASALVGASDPFAGDPFEDDPFGASLQAPALPARAPAPAPLGLTSHHELPGLSADLADPFDASGLDRALGADLGEGGFALDDDDESDTGVIRPSASDELRIRKEERIRARWS